MSDIVSFFSSLTLFGIPFWYIIVGAFLLSFLFEFMISFFISCSLGGDD